MSEQEIIEGNKLIAKFLYRHLYEDDGIDSWIEESGKVLFYLEDAKYHSSWDWLMPVVSKIGKMYEDLKTHIKLKLQFPMILIAHMQMLSVEM